ncbi:MAG: alpha/beta fold hydrolase [Nanoarchaeota archaeon]
MAKAIVAVFAVFAAVLVLASGCVMPIEKISIKAEDGIVIASYYYDNENPKANVLLLHALGRNKADWDGLAKELQKKGYAVLAVDFRAHGESWGAIGSQLDYQKFILDVKAGEFFLRTEHPSKELIIGGASIGANLGLQFASQNTDANVTKLVLLSPGLDYKGIATDRFIEDYSNYIFIAAAKDDIYAYNSAQELSLRTASPASKRTFIFVDGIAHGTFLLNDKAFKKGLIDWVIK